MAAAADVAAAAAADVPVDDFARGDCLVVRAFVDFSIVRAFVVFFEVDPRVSCVDVAFLPDAFDTFMVDMGLKFFGAVRLRVGRSDI